MVRRVQVGISTLPHPPYVCFRADGSSLCDRRVRRTDCEGKLHVCVLLGVCWNFDFFLFSGPLLPLFPGDERRAAEFSYFLAIRPCRRCKELTLALSTRDDIYSAEPTPSLKPRRHANKGSSTSRRTSISLAFPKLTKHAHKSRHAEIFQLLSPLITVSTSCSNILLYASNPVPAGTHLPHR